MIDWEEVLNSDSRDDLKEVKSWLFQENMRLEQERRRIEQERADVEKAMSTLNSARDKFNRERNSFKDEMNLLNRRSVIERKRLKEEKLFFDKKLAILQNGFLQLDLDRKSLERERINFENEKNSATQSKSTTDYYTNSGSIVDILFRNATNPLTLRKRYKDLMKIFHPDNIAGDEELVQMINKEFTRRRREEA